MKQQMSQIDKAIETLRTDPRYENMAKACGITPDYKACESCGGGGKVEGFTRFNGWAIAAYVECKECGGKGE